jgi:hypothetical protein
MDKQEVIEELTASVTKHLEKHYKKIKVSENWPDSVGQVFPPYNPDKWFCEVVYNFHSTCTDIGSAHFRGEKSNVASFHHGYYGKPLHCCKLWFPLDSTVNTKTWIKNIIESMNSDDLVNLVFKSSDSRDASFKPQIIINNVKVTPASMMKCLKCRISTYWFYKLKQ